MAKKYYAVRKGLKKGIFNTWDECKINVLGYSGAEYKSFPTMEEAEEYMGTTSEAAPVSHKDLSKATSIGSFRQESMFPIHEEEPLTKDLDEQGYLELENADIISAFVDGSYDKDIEYYGFGFIAYGMNHIHKQNGAGNEKNMRKMRNVAGEILASIAAIEYAISKGAKKVIIYHDYIGISKWGVREWKTNKEETRAYAEKCVTLSDKIEIAFRKVAGHTGIKGNEIADHLAGSAITEVKNRTGWWG